MARRASALVAAVVTAVIAGCVDAERGPVLFALAPSRAAPGDTVTALGRGLCGVAVRPGSACDEPIAAFLTVGTFEVSPPAQTWTDAEIRFAAPDLRAGAYLVVVTVDGVPTEPVAVELLEQAEAL